MTLPTNALEVALVLLPVFKWSLVYAAVTTPAALLAAKCIDTKDSDERTPD